MRRSRRYKRGLSDKAITIYTLTDPVTCKIFYVGRTTLLLNRRLNAAPSNKEVAKYVNNLKLKGLAPIIEPIDYTNYQNRKELEEYWIQQIAAWGFTLLNTKHYKQRNYISKHKKNTRLTQQEKEIIDILYRRGDNSKIAKALGMSNEMVRLYKNRTTIPVWLKDKIIDYYRDKARSISEWYQRAVVE